MIAFFIRKVLTGFRFAKPKIVICVPTGITQVEKRAVIESAHLAGARDVKLVEEPMGAFENPAFAQGSFTVAHIVAGIRGMSIVGGGDTAVVVDHARLADKMTFVSTGGGASLEFLEGKELPAFAALKECQSCGPSWGTSRPTPRN